MNARSIGTLPGDEPPFTPIAGLDEDARQGTYFSVIFPSCQFAVSQNCMWWLNVTPISAEGSVLEVGGCFPQRAVEAPNFASKAAPYYRRRNAVAVEDAGILEKQQRALSSVLYRSGPLSGRDDKVQEIGAWVVRRLTPTP